MKLRSGRRYHPYGGRPKRSYRGKSKGTQTPRRRKKVYSNTNRREFASGVGTFRGKKTSLRAYRNRLWNDTLFKPHYRSLFDTTEVFILTPNNTNQATLAIYNALPTFWVSGLQQLDSGVTPPLFRGDIILRGGLARISLSNNRDIANSPDTDNVRVTVYGVWTTALPQTPLPLPATVSTMWDPSVVTEFEKFGKVLFKKECILKADGDSVQIDFKFKVQKIDQGIFSQAIVNGPRGQTLVWMVLASQMSNQEATPAVEGISVVTSHNLSFSADAIGTT